MNAFKYLVMAMLLTLAANAAQAQIVVYTDRNAFMAAVSSPGTDTFNDLPIAPIAGIQNRMAGAHSYTAAVGPISPYFYPAGSAGDVWLATNNLYDTMTFTPVTAGVNAIGGYFFGTDVAGQFQPGSDIQLVANFGSGQQAYTINNATTSSFIGFISLGDSLVNLMVSSTGVDSCWPTANDLVLGITPIPEPASYSMLLAGMLTLAWLARRRR